MIGLANMAGCSLSGLTQAGVSRYGQGAVYQSAADLASAYASMTGRGLYSGLYSGITTEERMQIEVDDWLKDWDK